MFLFSVFVIVVLIVIVDEFFVKDRRAQELAKNIPGPVDLPLIGGSHQLFKLTLKDRCVNVNVLPKYYKNIMKMRVLNKIYIVVYKPEYIEKILNTPLSETKNDLYRVLILHFGNGILGTPPIDIWKRQRKLMSPVFSQKSVNSYMDIFSEDAVELIENLKKIVAENPGKEIDLAYHVTNYAGNIIGKAFFDFDFSKEAPEIDHGKLFPKIADQVFEKLFTATSYIPFLYRLSKHYQFDVKQKIFYDNLARKIINSKKEKNKLNSRNDSSRRLIDILLENNSNGKISDGQMIEEVKNLYGAATDTNGITTCYALMLLGMYPEIQEKLYEEAISVLGQDRKVELEDLSQLKYAECVIKETLRIFPTVPGFGREPQQDVTLDEGLTVPKGSSVIVNLVPLHRNEDYWPDPLKFDPDRFLPENSINRHPYSYLPFAGGSRNCIGMRYAINVLKILVAMIIREFRVKTTCKSIEDVEIIICVSSKPAAGFGLTLEKR